MLKNIKERYIDRYPQLKISLGDTPSCSLADRFGVADEIRPGNFVFYDVTQLKIGSCDWYNIALAVKCPVVDINRHRNEAVIYGGGVHFSKDRIDRPGNRPLYGMVAENHNDYWGNIISGVELVSLSQVTWRNALYGRFSRSASCRGCCHRIACAFLYDGRSDENLPHERRENCRPYLKHHGG